MEFLDIVDKNDKVIGRASKQEVYEKLYTHRIVHILIFNEKNEMALQLRANVSFCPFHWSTAVGGHVQSGESYEDAAIREFEEELGATSEIKFFSKDFYQSPGIPDKFLATFKTVYNGPFEINPEAVEKINFFTTEEIQKMINNGEKIHPELLFILRKHFHIK